jgi:hypothetical protein
MHRKRGHRCVQGNTRDFRTRALVSPFSSQRSAVISCPVAASQIRAVPSLEAMKAK